MSASVSLLFQDKNLEFGLVGESLYAFRNNSGIRKALWIYKVMRTNPDNPNEFRIMLRQWAGLKNWNTAPEHWPHKKISSQEALDRFLAICNATNVTFDLDSIKEEELALITELYNDVAQYVYGTQAEFLHDLTKFGVGSHNDLAMWMVLRDAYKLFTMGCHLNPYEKAWVVNELQRASIGQDGVHETLLAYWKHYFRVYATKPHYCAGAQN